MAGIDGQRGEWTKSSSQKERGFNYEWVVYNMPNTCLEQPIYNKSRSGFFWHAGQCLKGSTGIYGFPLSAAAFIAHAWNCVVFVLCSCLGIATRAMHGIH